VDVRQGTVTYVSGNDLVVKMQDGTLKHFVVPPDQTFDVDGKNIKISELKPGTRLMQVIVTTTKDVTVSSVRNVDLKVVQVLSSQVNVMTAEGTQKLLRVPDGTVFEIDGKDMKLSDLREGMRIKGTVVTKSPQTLVSQTKTTVGTAPIEVPKLVGVLLIEEK
jgi:hypothetical protein